MKVMSMSFDVNKNITIEKITKAFLNARQKFWNENKNNKKSFAEVAGEYLFEEGITIRDIIKLDENQSLIVEELSRRKLNLMQTCVDIYRKFIATAALTNPSKFTNEMSKILQPHFITWVKRAEDAELQIISLSDKIIKLEKLNAELSAKNLELEVDVSHVTKAVKTSIALHEQFPPNEEHMLTEETTTLYHTSISHLKSFIS